MMEVLIVEDELPAARRLERMLAEAAPECRIAATLDSVATAKAWLEANPAPALIFMDVHLTDGSAFDLLKAVEVGSPVIFTTAYDEYALQAIQSQGIAYLLKPVRAEDLRAALDKAARLTGAQAASQAGSPAQPYKQRFLIRLGDFIRTVSTDEIAYCYSQQKSTMIKTSAGRDYPVDMNLDALEAALDPAGFFRLNRQYIVSLRAIAEMRAYSKGRVVLRLTPDAGEQPVVSAERSAAFKRWLGGD